ncbi:MAG: Fic family protein [Nitriliruptorales bacterium]|nr:Fic family protein [Nitriliruptorales bacterium]
MTEVRFGRSTHLVDLIAAVERLAERLREQPDPDQDVAERLREEAALASLRLDGSQIEQVPTATPAASATGQTPKPRQGTWLDAMAERLDEADDEEIMAREYQGVRAAMAADDLADELLTAPIDTCAELHRRLTTGLLAEEHAGRPRVSEQAVQDASVGRIIYFPTEPADIPSHLNLLAGWLETTGAREHALVTSGVLHFELLRIHPYEAANGRLARAASRLVLRARGLDPSAVATPEVALARDPIGYYEEVAKTIRRRDLTIWLERWGEAVAAGLRQAVTEVVGQVARPPSRRPLEFVDGWGEPAFTIADYRARVGVGPEDAKSDLRELLDAGRVRRVPGSRGLRYELVY